MALDRLWAPWRMEFIRNVDAGEGCFLCEAVKSTDDAASLLVRRGETCFCVLNRYPYCNGHLLISPYRHEGRLESLTRDELCEIMLLAVEGKQALDRVMGPHGYNMGANLGRAAGAGLEAHFHLHVVPRWEGDTNFVTTLGSTRVIPQALEELWAMVTEAWGKTTRDE